MCIICCYAHIVTIENNIAWTASCRLGLLFKVNLPLSPRKKQNKNTFHKLHFTCEFLTLYKAQSTGVNYIILLSVWFVLSSNVVFLLNKRPRLHTPQGPKCSVKIPSPVHYICPLFLLLFLSWCFSKLEKPCTIPT